MSFVRILGVDPGSRITGYGVVDSAPNRVVHVASGCLHLRAESMPGRLDEIFSGLGAIIEAHSPTELSIERVFMHRNADSAIKLGQARGVALVAATSHHLSVEEYSPNQIKQSVTGRGHAAKQQVQHMIRVLLNLDTEPPTDAADALAAAICHAHFRETKIRLASAGA